MYDYSCSFCLNTEVKDEPDYLDPCIRCGKPMHSTGEHKHSEAELNSFFSRVKRQHMELIASLGLSPEIALVTYHGIDGDPTDYNPIIVTREEFEPLCRYIFRDGSRSWASGSGRLYTKCVNCEKILQNSGSLWFWNTKFYCGKACLDQARLEHDYFVDNYDPTPMY